MRLGSLTARLIVRALTARLIVRALTILLLATTPASAQSGALFLLAPFGARAVGLGEAVSADTTLGAEGVWWNAAALARMSSKEIAFHHSQTFLANSEMLTVVVPSRVIGTIGFAGYFVDYGDVQATDEFGNPTGVISNRSYLLSASYATPVGRRANVGLTYKYFLQRFNDCSGSCGLASVGSGSSSAVDVGAQYLVPAAIPLAVGLSVRNLGPRLQIKDQPQADPLPRIVQGGVSGATPVRSPHAFRGGTRRECRPREFGGTRWPQHRDRRVTQLSHRVLPARRIQAAARGRRRAIARSGIPAGRLRFRFLTPLRSDLLAGRGDTDVHQPASDVLACLSEWAT